MQNKKTFIIIAVVVAIAVILTGVRFVTTSKGSVKEVDTVKAATKDLIQSITVTGNIQANNKEDIVLSSMQKITQVLAQEGQQVKAGDLIARVDTTDYTYQLQKLQKSYEVTKLNLDMAKSNLNNLVNTKSASSKKTLESAVQQAQINLENIKRNLADAKTKLEQNQELLGSGVISPQEYESSVKAVADLENQVKLSEIQLENAKRNLADYGVENKSQVDQQKNQVAQLTKQLESARADIDNIANKLTSSEIKTSIDGKIVKLNILANQYPTQENNMITIYDLSKYKVTVNVSQYDAVQISEGQNARIKIKGLDTVYDGTVTKIGEAAELSMTGATQEAKVKVEVVLTNPDNKIKVGYEADVDIILIETKNALSVNFEAVQTDRDGKDYVFVIKNDKAEKRYVKRGTETEFDIQIIDGLKADEQYVKNPPVSLKEGDRVRAAGGK